MSGFGAGCSHSQGSAGGETSCSVREWPAAAADWQHSGSEPDRAEEGWGGQVRENAHTNTSKQKVGLAARKMNVYWNWVTNVVKMPRYFWNRHILTREKGKRLFYALQLPECTALAIFQPQQEFNIISAKGTALWPVNKQYAILNPVTLCSCGAQNKSVIFVEETSIIVMHYSTGTQFHNICCIALPILLCVKAGCSAGSIPVITTTFTLLKKTLQTLMVTQKFTELSNSCWPVCRHKKITTDYSLACSQEQSGPAEGCLHQAVWRLQWAQRGEEENRGTHMWHNKESSAKF